MSSCFIVWRTILTLGGQPKLKTTKSHRRVGSVGSTGDARIWPGKRMPGNRFVVCA